MKKTYIRLLIILSLALLIGCGSDKDNPGAEAGSSNPPAEENNSSGSASNENSKSLLGYVVRAKAHSEYAIETYSSGPVSTVIVSLTMSIDGSDSEHYFKAPRVLHGMSPLVHECKDSECKEFIDNQDETDSKDSLYKKLGLLGRVSCFTTTCSSALVTFKSHAAAFFDHEFAVSYDRLTPINHIATGSIFLRGTLDAFANEFKKDFSLKKHGTFEITQIQDTPFMSVKAMTTIIPSENHREFLGLTISNNKSLEEQKAYFERSLGAEINVDIEGNRKSVIFRKTDFPNQNRVELDSFTGNADFAWSNQTGRIKLLLNINNQPHDSGTLSFTYEADRVKELAIPNVPVSEVGVLF